MKTLVILTSYNGEKYINEQIDSILNQTGIELKINIYDDCSTDKTLKQLESYNTSKIKVIQNAKCTGSAAINFCNAILNLHENELSEYTYYALSDQDDVWFNKKIITAIKKLQEHNASLYASNLIMFNGPSSKLNITGMIKKNHSQKKYDYLFEGGSAGCTYVMDKSLIIKIKQILNTIDYVNWKYFSHDWFIYFIARNNGFKVFIDSESFIYYRIHENNAHGHLNALSIKSVIKKANLFNNGWYINQINGFQKLLKHNSVEFKIYQSFKKNWLLRIFIIFRFNFNLIRNPTKFFQFVILNFLSVKKHI